jgi:nitrite reductase (NADH) large subunit
MKVLIVGNGVAGISLARELRARVSSPDDLRIAVLARESYDYYSRIRLPEVFGGESMSAQLLALYKPSWYAERHIEVLLGKDVSAIDRAARRVLLASGDEIAYDVLALAVGAEPVRPDLPGSYLPGVFALREYDDAARIKAASVARPGPAAVVGGGLLGLEAARHLQLEGSASVTVLEVAPRLLPRQLDPGGAALLERTLAGMGVRTVTGAKLTAFEGQDRLEGLAFESGGASRRLEAALAVLSMGVRPRVGLAKAAGLATARGVVVDRFLRTSDPSVYALGDCAEFGGAAPCIIPAALEQAPCCAAAILGDESRPYSGTVPSNTLKVAGIELFSAGAVEKRDGMEEIVLEPAEGRYERYLFQGGERGGAEGAALAGAIVIGSKARARAVAPLMGKSASRAAIEALPS